MEKQTATTDLEVCHPTKLGDLQAQERKKKQEKLVASYERKIEVLTDWLLTSEFQTEEWDGKLLDLEHVEEQLANLKFLMG